MKVLCLLLVICVLASCSRNASGSAACTTAAFEAASFTTCVFDSEVHAIELASIASDGSPYRSFSAASRDFPGASVSFAMNAGMFDAAGAPIGLYVERGKVLHPLNTGHGTGNFYLHPNGVFWVDAAGQPHITETGVYMRSAPSPAWASQSGPMLVVGGKKHASIADDGTSRFVRNAVGVDCNAPAVFVISEQPISFGKIARFFRDVLKCKDALYFDGAVSSLWVPSLNRMDARDLLGPLVFIRPR